MKHFKSILQSLRSSDYLAVKHLRSNSRNECFKPFLLKHGQMLAEQLLNQWSKSSITWAPQQCSIYNNKLNQLKSISRISFLNTSEFRNSYEEVYKPYLNQSKSIEFKTVSRCVLNNNLVELPIKHHEQNEADELILLISDYFVPASYGLERFYNIQRERIIWWKRFSANPSQYFVDSYKFLYEDCKEAKHKCKSITIKLRFPLGAIGMEIITLLPLYELSSWHNKDCLKLSLIRSVINLNLSTFALILEGTECNCYKALMLHRTLAPYQILLTNLDKSNKMVCEMSRYLLYTIAKLGIRVHEECVTTNLQRLERDCETFDGIGIPYIVIIDEECVNTGLIKLRNRDTTVFEKIHITDLRNYLLRIFTAY